MDEEQPRTNDLYDMEAVLDRVRNAARLYLSDPWTVETIRWEDGDFRVEAFHTIDATYPFEEEAETPGGLDGDDARPFYRERVVFSTVRDAGYVFLEVVRKRTGRTASESVYRTPVEWVGPRDTRTADASLTLDGKEHALRDLELQEISLVPTEEALDGNRVVDTVPYGERELEFSGTLRFDGDENGIPVSVDSLVISLPRDVETVGDFRDALDLDAGREIVRVVEGDEEIYPGQSRLGVDRLGDPDDPVVVSEGDEFLIRDRREDEGDDVKALYQSLEQVRRDLLDVAEQAEEAGVPLVARNLELWSHSAAVFHADLTHSPPPGTIVDYLEQADYEPPERGREDAEE